MRPLAALALFCLAACSRTGTLTLRLTREGELDFSVVNGLDEYPIHLDTGLLNIDTINVVAESDPFSTRIVDTPTLYNFVEEPDRLLLQKTFPPKGFDQIHVFFDNSIQPGLDGLALSLEGTVTLTDGRTLPLLVHFPLEERAAQEIFAAITIPIRDEEEVELILVPEVLLTKINFDAAASEDEVRIEPGTENPGVENALRILEENLFLCFRFDGPTGNSNE